MFNDFRHKTLVFDRMNVGMGIDSLTAFRSARRRSDFARIFPAPARPRPPEIPTNGANETRLGNACSCALAPPLPPKYG